MCLALSGLVALAIAYGGTATYVSIMPDHPSPSYGLDTLTAWHNAWFAYVTGDAPLDRGMLGNNVFTANEYAHMADVRSVFIAFRAVAAVAATVGIALVLRVATRGRRAAELLIRDAALGAAVGVAAIAVAAVVAFDPLFLLFHEVFFPQGNFLFPADSNLLVVYPDEYWSGVTLRIGFTFAAAMAAIALAATATLRQGRR